MTKRKIKKYFNKYLIPDLEDAKKIEAFSALKKFDIKDLSKMEYNIAKIDGIDLAIQFIKDWLDVI